MKSLEFVDLQPGDPRLIREVLPVLSELRTELSASELEAVYAEGYPQGLRFTAAYEQAGRCVAVAGWRVVATTVCGRKLYVDDLVTTTSARGRGIGSALLSELAERARAAECSVIDLDSGLHRTDAHRFYLREGMPVHSLHFLRRLR